MPGWKRKRLDDGAWKPAGSSEGRRSVTKRVAGIVLAAGRSTRMGATNKLVALVDGRPMARRVVEALVEADVSPVAVITGHDEAAVRAACAGAPVGFVHNPDHAQGMSTSIRAGVEAVGADLGVEGLLVALGDMPWLEARHVWRLVDAFRRRSDVVAPRFEGRRGHPVLFGRDFFPELARVSGDAGARSILRRLSSEVTWVDLPDDAVLRDVDTPEDLLDASVSGRDPA